MLKGKQAFALVETWTLLHGFAQVPVLSRGKLQFLTSDVVAQQSADLW